MKKSILILLLLVSIFSLIGCGKDENKEKELSKEEVMKEAKDLEISSLNYDIRDNKARAEQYYIGNYFKVSGFILEIKSDYVSLSDSNNNNGRIQVYLPQDELVKLKKDYKITVVGKITAFKEEQKDYLDSYTVMKNAYYVTNEIEIDADIETCATLQGDNLYCKTKYPVYYLHVSSEQIKEINEKGKKVKVKGNIPKGPQYGYPSGVNVVNVEIIE